MFRTLTGTRLCDIGCGRMKFIGMQVSINLYSSYSQKSASPVQRLPGPLGECPGGKANPRRGIGGCTKGAANLTPLEVAKGDLGLRLDSEDVLRQILRISARASTLRGAVEPDHGTVRRPPDAKGHDHAAGHGVAHDLEGAEPVKGTGAAGGAVVVGDGVNGRQALLGDRLGLENNTVLDVETRDGRQLPSGLVDGELCHHGKGLGGVDIELGALAVVVGLVESVRVPAATILVAHSV